MEDFLLTKKWLTPQQNQELIEGVERELEADREAAVNSPMPQAETAAQGVYCEGCHRIELKYGEPQVKQAAEPAKATGTDAAGRVK